MRACARKGVRVQVPPWAQKYGKPSYQKNMLKRLRTAIAAKFWRGVKIRQFSLSDLDRVAEIGQNSLPSPWPKSLFVKTHKLYPESFFVAEKKGEVIGYITGRPDKGASRINSLAIDKKWRKKGVGRVLVDYLMAQFKIKGGKEAFLHVRARNKEALNFYQDLRFKITETIKNHYRNGDDACLMKKNLGG